MPGISLHANPHVGFVAVGLAVVAFWYRRKSAIVRWFGFVALGGLLLALGKDFPLYWLIYRFVPMVEKAREPAMAIVLCQVGIAVLAALGAGRLSQGLDRPLALALFLAEAVYDAPHLGRFDRPGSYTATIQGQADIAEFLKAQPGWFRVDFDDNDVSYNFGNLYGIEQFGGVGSSLPVADSPNAGERGDAADVRHTLSCGAQAVGYRAGRSVPVAQRAEGVPGCPHCRASVDVARWRLAAMPIDCAWFRGRRRSSWWKRNWRARGWWWPDDAYYPGWRAWVDGERRPVQELDAVRAVRAGAGHHVIEFRYRPASVYRGLGLTLLGFGGDGVFLLSQSEGMRRWNSNWMVTWLWSRAERAGSAWPVHARWLKKDVVSLCGMCPLTSRISAGRNSV